MRLSEYQHKNIVSIAKDVFGESTVIYIFGSRIDDKKKGGDIDLLIKPGEKTDEYQLFDKKISFLIKLKQKIGNRSIDVVFDNNKKNKASFINEIYKQGICL